MKTTKNKIVDPKKAKKINYKSAKFRRGLEAVNKRNSTSESFKNVDDTKLHCTFSI